MIVTPATTSAHARTAGAALVTAAAAAAGAAAAGWAGAAVAAVGGAVALGMGPRLMSARRPVRVAARVVVAIAFVWPIAMAVIRGAGSASAVPLELPLIAGCRNALLGLVVLADGHRAWRRAAAASLFVMLLATMRLPPTVAVPLLAGYAVTGCMWLAASQSWVGGFRGIGPAVIATVLVTGGTLLGAVLVSGNGVGATVRGFLPSSGGAGSGSELATSGLGNGPDEVPGSARARSAGFDQSETFMNSEQSGLYDAFLETAGEPLKKGNFEKLQMLRAKEIRWAASTGIEDYRGGRRFTLDRQPPPPPTATAESHAATALLYVDGPLPVHLRTTAYDAFDGATWTEATAGWPGHDLHDATKADPWFPVGGTGGRSYTVRLGSLVTNGLPVPALASRFHLGRVVMARLIGWQGPDVLRMRRTAVPPGTVLDVDCTPFDPGRYPVDAWLNDLSSQRATAGKIADPRLSRLARDWTSGQPRGWAQVDAVCRGLRERCVLDRAYRPADAAAVDRLAEFLFDARRGPDFLFASAVAVMLREVGYTTRLAGGFYVGPADDDGKSRQGLVTARCAHLWAEVRLPDGRWAVVEATPGYAVAGPDPPWATRALATVRLHAVGLAMSIGGLMAMGAGRLWLIDIVSVVVLRAWPGRTWIDRVARTWRLVELRARWAGRARPAGVTPRQWLRSAVPANGVTDRFADAVTWASYGPAVGPWSADEVRDTCRVAARLLTATRLRRHGGKPS